MIDGLIRERAGPLFYFFCFFLLLCVVLGGISSNDTPTNPILQALALAPLAGALFSLINAPSLSFATRVALGILAAALLIPLAQLVPLPESLAKILPFHDLVAAAQQALGERISLTTLTLAPDATLTSLLSCLPAVSAFLYCATLPIRARGKIVGVLMAGAIVSAFVGLLQLSQNSASGFYLYPEGPGDVVGFFANRNHFAALIYGLLPFSVAWMASAVDNPRQVLRQDLRQDLGQELRQEFYQELHQESPQEQHSSPRHAGSKINYLLLFCGAAAFFILIVVAIMARSRAGVVLLMLALLGVSFLPRWRLVASGAARGGGALVKIFLGLAGFSLLFALEYGFFRLLSRFEADPLQDARLEIAKNTYALVIKALPTGSGLGTFQKIYAAFEPVRDIVANSFINRAHNDFLEFALEGGAPALLVTGAFLVWFYGRARDAWSTREGEEGDAYVRRAASLTVLLLLLHAAVDYALRTHAVMLLFAASCALLLPLTPGARGAPAQDAHINPVSRSQAQHRRSIQMKGQIQIQTQINSQD